MNSGGSARCCAQPGGTMNRLRHALGRDERGQILVIVAGGMIALLAIAALVLEGGTLMLNRRDAQNGADLASVAGTRGGCAEVRRHGHGPRAEQRLRRGQQIADRQRLCRRRRVHVDRGVRGWQPHEPRRRRTTPAPRSRPTRSRSTSWSTSRSARSSATRSGSTPGRCPPRRPRGSGARRGASPAASCCRSPSAAGPIRPATTARRRRRRRRPATSSTSRRGRSTT